MYSPSLHYIAKSTSIEVSKFFKFFLLGFLGIPNVSRKARWLLQLKRQSVILPLTRSYQLSEDLTLGSRWMTNFSIFSNPCWKTKWPLLKVTVLYLTTNYLTNLISSFQHSILTKNLVKAKSLSNISWKRWCFWNFFFSCFKIEMSS